MVKIVYFAWVRERIGKAGETLDLPDSIVTVADLIAWLTARGPEYANAFARPEVIRAAIDQSHVKPAAKIAGAREIAFFPPVTGG
jgi:sulfur-carrier protein